jgi:large subunit ribosomal protein L35Ae
MVRCFELDMQGLIVSYRRSQRDQTSNQAIVKVEGVKDKAAAQALVGKTAKWKSVHAEIPGVVSAAHGNSGAIRIHFQRGIPGQAITTNVEIQ